MHVFDLYTVYQYGKTSESALATLFKWIRHIEFHKIALKIVAQLKFIIHNFQSMQDEPAA